MAPPSLSRSSGQDSPSPALHTLSAQPRGLWETSGATLGTTTYFSIHFFKSSLNTSQKIFAKQTNRKESFPVNLGKPAKYPGMKAAGVLQQLWPLVPCKSPPMFLALCSDPKLLAVASRDDRVSSTKEGLVWNHSWLQELRKWAKAPQMTKHLATPLERSNGLPGSPTVCHRLSCG